MNIESELAEVTDHLNADHADTVTLVGRFLAGNKRDLVAVGAVTATLRGVDPFGADVSVRAPAATSVSVRHEFSNECATIEEVRIEFFGLLTAAREWIGDAIPLTSLEREMSGVGYTTYFSEVSAVVDITPTLRQITFRGGLDDYASLGGDEYLYVLLPPRGRSDLTVGADFSWLDTERMPESERPTGAYYSVRRWRPEDRSLDMWFVLHGDAGDASAWASRAELGQPVGLWGPRRTFAPPVGTSSYLFVTDVTGFGATGALLDGLIATDPHVRACVIAESGRPTGRVEFPTGAGVDIAWVDRNGQPPGTTSLLVDAVSELDVEPGVYAYGAGESRRITAVRRHLRDVIGLPAEQVKMTGYWRAS